MNWTNLRELVMSLVWSEEAIVSMLEEKGILTRAEVLEKIKELREAQAKGPKH